MPVSPKNRPSTKRPAATSGAAVPDGVAVHDDAGELIGWDESAVCAYLAEHGLPSRCDDDCMARDHIDYW